MERDEKKFTQYIEKLRKDGVYPGLAISIRGPQGVVFEGGFGQRSADGKKLVDKDTVFGIASMSKSMTALACCILHMEGKLSLKDSITKYFPDLHIPGTPDECVSLESIAMHRAGLPPMPPLEWSIVMNSVERDSEYRRHMMETAPNKMDKIEQIVEYISNGKYKPIGSPGEYMSYSNEGYALLSYVVDQAAGIPLEQFLTERIFEPLGMSRTVLDLDSSKAHQLADENITSLFEKGDEKGEILSDDNWSVLPPFRGCACVKSTASDMSRYYKMLADKGRWEGKQVVAEEAVELLAGAGFPVREDPFYCLGLEKRLMDGRIVCQHSGGLHGVSSCGGYLDNGYSAVVLCNLGENDVEDFQWACYNYILGLPLDKPHRWAEPSGKTFSMPQALCGDYLAEEGLPVHTIVTYTDGQLRADYGDTPVNLLYCRDTVFAAVSVKDPKIRISTFRFYLRDGKAWAVKCYNRIYQRVD